MELYEELRQRENEVDRHEENSARLAQVNAKYATTGQGSIQFTRRVDFELTFIEEPYMSYGCRIDVDELAELLNIDSGLNDPVPLPLSTGYVVEWDRDERDFYIGAWVGARVYFPPDSAIPPVPSDPALAMIVPYDTPVSLAHYFNFHGVAMKDIPLGKDG